MVKTHISKQLYVTCRESFDTEKFPLAFVTPYDKDTAEFKRRQGTADSWAGYKNEKATKVFLDNNPIEGFSIDSVAHRYVTQNKLFNIKDPRGFTTQVSAENLFNLIGDSVIEYGKIKGEHLWARVAGQNILIPKDGEIYKNSFNAKTDKKIRLSNLEPGDVVDLGTGNDTYICTFLGRYYLEYFGIEKSRVNRDRWGASDNSIIDINIKRSRLTQNQYFIFAHEHEDNVTLIPYKSNKEIISVIKNDKNYKRFCPDMENIYLNASNYYSDKDDSDMLKFRLSFNSYCKNASYFSLYDNKKSAENPKRTINEFRNSLKDESYVDTYKNVYGSANSWGGTGLYKKDLQDDKDKLKKFTKELKETQEIVDEILSSTIHPNED